MRAVALLLLCGGCVGTVGTSHEAIIGGVSDTGDPAVVLLVSYPANMSTYYTCTASVISPKVLVTAAHCVDDAKHAGYTFGMFAGADASAYSTASAIAPALAAIDAVHAHPDYNPNAPFVADIGVAILAQPTSVTPLPISRSTLSSTLPGQPARLIGYGQTTYNTFNASKHEVSTTVDSLPNDDTVLVGDATRHSCVGDSGGPALVHLGGVETIIGVDSYTDTSGCKEPAHYRRTDLYLPFLDSYLPNSVHDLGVADAAHSSVAEDAGASNVDAAISSPTSDGCAMTGRPASWNATVALFALALLLRRRATSR